MKRNDKKLKKQFAENLYELRIKNGLSVQELADKAGFSRQQIYNYQSGQDFPSIKSMSALAGALDCEVKDLFN